MVAEGEIFVVFASEVSVAVLVESIVEPVEVKPVEIAIGLTDMIWLASRLMDQRSLVLLDFGN